MKASRSEDDNNETKETFDVMIDKQQLVVNSLAHRGHAKGVPQTGNAAKGVEKKGGSAKGVPQTGNRAKGVANTGDAAKGPAN